jgi:hypothetical protein
MVQQQRSREAQELKKTEPEEILVQNPDWIDYPDIYVVMKGIMFIDEDEDEEIENDKEEAEVITISNPSNSENTPTPSESEQNYDNDKPDDNEVPTFNELFGIDDEPPTKVIAGYTIDTRTGETLSGPNDDKPPIDNRNNSNNNAPLPMAEQGDGYWDDEANW